MSDQRNFTATCVAGHETTVIGHRIASDDQDIERFIFGSAADFCAVCDEPIPDDALVPTPKDVA